MKKIIFTLSITTIALTSCTSNQKENNLESLDKKSAREVTLKTIVAGDSILHITSQSIWVNGELLTQKTDTIKTAKAINDWGATEPISLEKVPIYVTVE